ncbi:MAG TPA: 3-phosphoshikimate 1-carboxyvinyltransferase [Acidimicrobiia bacterium]|nr:3-phosphoshikimate 1-carboxyvinyltransferase [Acidimicrobiia bacterium]
MTLPAEMTFGGARSLRGRLRVPGDKSISHRALLFAGLAHGKSAITHLADGDDVHRTRLALEHLGVGVRTSRDGAVHVQGTGIDGWREPERVLDCGNSGTSTRVLAGALAGRPFLSVLTGDASLAQRPMARVVEPLRAMGATIDGRGDGRYAPLTIRGGALRGITHELAVASAQVKSALVLAGLQAVGDTEIVEPVPSRDHTERMLATLGAPVERVEPHTVRVRAGAPSAFELDVPGDPSSAAFFVVSACITPGSSIVLEGVSLNPTRIGFLEVLRRMGARITLTETAVAVGEPVGDIAVEASELQGTEIAGAEIPNVIDEIPALAIAAAFADGVTEIRDAAELLVKESDRIGTIEQELTQLGIGVEPRADGLTIRGGRARAGTLKSHGDHRIAMSAAIALHALDAESTVRGWKAVASSYPGFADDLRALTDAQ